MTEENANPSEFNTTMQNIRVTPINSLSVANDIPTSVADFVKVLIDHETSLCTFLFFRKHVKPIRKDANMMIEGVHEEAFLEVKVPYNTAFALALYMNEVLKDMQKSPRNGRGFDFGPSAIRSG